jgi:putative ABC transport system permease protein
VRHALGASDGRLRQQLLVQSLLLGAVGTGLGLALAPLLLQSLRGLLPPDVPRTAGIALDLPPLAMVAGAGMLATLAFGVAAALRGRAPVHLAAGARLTTPGPRPRGGALVVAEVAIGLALTILSLLMARSLVTLRAVELGFDGRGVVAGRVGLGAAYDTPERRRVFFEELAARTRALPGVASVGLVSARPFFGPGPATTVHDADGPAPSPAEALVADVRYVDDGFFATLRVPFAQGQPFGGRPGPPYAVVNESLARTLWPGQPVVGRRLHLKLFGGITAEVSGVVRDIRLASSRTPARATVFLPTAAWPPSGADLLVRSHGDPEALVPSLRAVVAGLDAGLPLYRVETMPSTVAATLATDRFATLLLAAFAAVALALAAVGIAGVFVAEVGHRRREIGIRMALGGRPAGIVGLFLRTSARQAALGIAVGTAVGWAGARGLASLLYGVSTADPRTFLGATLLVATVTALATAAPAWRALRGSPLAALRE